MRGQQVAGAVAVAMLAGAGLVTAAPSAGAAASPGTAAVTTGGKPAPGTAFTAYGTRTPWRAVVRGGVLSLEGKGITTRPIRVSRSAFSKGVEFTGRDQGREVTLVVRSGRCIDPAGQNTGMRATLTLGTKLLRGCAAPGATPIPNT